MDEAARLLFVSFIFLKPVSIDSGCRKGFGALKAAGFATKDELSRFLRHLDSENVLSAVAERPVKRDQTKFPTTKLSLIHI